jgi:hypothetical protein
LKSEIAIDSASDPAFEGWDMSVAKQARRIHHAAGKGDDVTRGHRRI